MKRQVLVALLLVLSILGASAADPSYADLDDAVSIAVDWSKGSTQAVTLQGNRTFAFSNARKGGHYLLIIRQDATGSRTATWPASVHWPGDNEHPPLLTTTANRKDYLSFFYDGVTYDLVGLSSNL